MGFFRLQSKLVYPLSFPPDCLKSLGESWKVCTPIQGRQRIFNPHWGYFYFIRQSPPRMVSIGERSSPPENFGNVQNSGEIPDIIKRRKGLIYQSFWLFFVSVKKDSAVFSGIDVFGEEGVRRWHMTDEKRHIGRKDNQRLPTYFLRITWQTVELRNSGEKRLSNV